MTRIGMSADDLSNYIETHSDPFFNILFVYAKLNPGINYVQGMNEVLAVIYYCFQKDEGLFSFQQNEADVFLAFSNLMIVMRDSFLRELDREESGLDGHMKHYA
jgi:hypothetical protein